MRGAACGSRGGAPRALAAAPAGGCGCGACMHAVTVHHRQPQRAGCALTGGNQRHREDEPASERHRRSYAPPCAAPPVAAQQNKGPRGAPGQQRRSVTRAQRRAAHAEHRSARCRARRAQSRHTFRPAPPVAPPMPLCRSALQNRNHELGVESVFPELCSWRRPKAVNGGPAHGSTGRRGAGCLRPGRARGGAGRPGISDRYAAAGRADRLAVCGAAPGQR